MTRDEFDKLFVPTPPVILCLDGKFGLVIRDWGTSAGVQVPGEEDIRDIPLVRIDTLGEALIERKPNE
jgi:hypothetical protein